MSSVEPTKEQWQAVRDLLKEGLLAGAIPVEPKNKPPKEVWKHYVDAGNADIQCIDYENKAVRDKFTRQLRSLRKKHKDGDLENEGKKSIEWGKSAAKQFLKKWFREKAISVEYHDPKQVWESVCFGHSAFERMEYDSAFVRRLAGVRDDHLKKLDRCEDDLQAYLIAKQNHPTPELNSRGEPQWNGSEAQALLADIVKKGQHKSVAPSALHSSRPEFQVYGLRTFRDHIYQEERLLKFHNWTEAMKQKKQESLQY